MKKISSFIIIFIMLITLTACSNKEKYNNVKDAPYYSYLNENNPVVEINVLNYGSIKVELFSDVAKNTVDNFLSYVIEEEYNNSSFHRVIKNFMIQGGIVNNTKDPIKGEFSYNGYENNLKHYRGVISMARTKDPNSATSQFFILDKTSPHLDGGYAAFGGVIEGFDVLDEIAKVKTDFSDQPKEAVIIKYIKLIKD